MCVQVCVVGMPCMWVHLPPGYASIRKSNLLPQVALTCLLIASGRPDTWTNFPRKSGRKIEGLGWFSSVKNWTFLDTILWQMKRHDMALGRHFIRDSRDLLPRRCRWHICLRSRGHHTLFTHSWRQTNMLYHLAVKCAHIFALFTYTTVNSHLSNNTRVKVINFLLKYFTLEFFLSSFSKSPDITVWLVWHSLVTLKVITICHGLWFSSQWWIGQAYYGVPVTP